MESPNVSLYQPDGQSMAVVEREESRNHAVWTRALRIGPVGQQHGSAGRIERFSGLVRAVLLHVDRG